MEIAAAEHGTLVRQALYRFYAGLLLYPEAERFETLKQGALWLEEALEAGPLDFRPELTESAREITRWIQSFTGDLREYQGEWVRLFGASRDGFCAPYEGAYRGASAAGPLIAELQKEYARAGVALSANDLPDHIAVELEYMSYLCGLELETLRSGEGTRRRRIVRAQYQFLEHHLCQWLPALLEQVVNSEGGVFVSVCRAAHELVSTDRTGLAAATTAAGAAQPG